MTIESIYQQIGHRIRIERTKRSLSQEYIAEKAGLSRASIVNIERGRQKIMLHSLYAVANSLGIPVTHLLPLSTSSADIENAFADEDQAAQKIYYKIKKETEGK